MSAPRPRTLIASLALVLAGSVGAPVGVGAAAAEVPCVNGFANQYPCKDVTLLAHMTPAQLGGGGGNDIWGWTDPETGREYALVGRTNATSFVDITVPTEPVYLGRLPTTQTSAGVLASWRDIKVFQDHAYIVSEEPAHGVQVFDLTRLRGVTSPQTFTVDFNYPLSTQAHNIAINEDTGYAYALGHISGIAGTPGACSGLHMIDINIPNVPVFAGCFELDGYTHDTQCVVYRGPDADYRDSEICFNSNEDTLTIVDVTNKLLPTQLARAGYPGAAYTHQGWLTEDHRYFLLGDEGDENGSTNTKTYVWDVQDLTNPQLIGVHFGRTRAIDHNLYIVDDLVYQANYTAGLAVLSLEDVANGRLRDVGYFDLLPSSDATSFNGAWSVYPFFESGTVIMNGMQQGLFILRPQVADLSVTQTDDPDPVSVGGTVTYTLSVENAGPYDAAGVVVTDLLPAGAGFLGAAGADCTHLGGLVTCDIGGLAVGEGATITIEAQVSQAGELTNTAQVAFDGADHIEANDSSSETTTAA